MTNSMKNYEAKLAPLMKQSATFRVAIAWDSALASLNRQPCWRLSPDASRLEISRTCGSITQSP